MPRITKNPDAVLHGSDIPKRSKSGHSDTSDARDSGSDALGDGEKIAIQEIPSEFQYSESKSMMDEGLTNIILVIIWSLVFFALGAMVSKTFWC